jgi:predicted DNA-binding transcriptional regulator AlpA
MSDNNLELLTADGSCAFLGGDKPINKSTLYRGVKAGKFPPPVKLGDATSRWVKAELAEAVRNAPRGR